MPEQILTSVVRTRYKIGPIVFRKSDFNTNRDAFVTVRNYSSQTPERRKLLTTNCTRPSPSLSALITRNRLRFDQNVAHRIHVQIRRYSNQRENLKSTGAEQCEAGINQNQAKQSGELVPLEAKCESQVINIIQSRSIYSLKQCLVGCQKMAFCSDQGFRTSRSLSVMFVEDFSVVVSAHWRKRLASAFRTLNITSVAAVPS